MSEPRRALRSRRALSRHWAGRTRAEQRELIALFTNLLERSYLSTIEAYSGEKVVYVGETIDCNYASVYSRIVTLWVPVVVQRPLVVRGWIGDRLRSLRLLS